MNKNINIEEVKDVINSILRVKEVLGPNNGIYKTMMLGLNSDTDEDFEETLKDPEKKEIVIAKSCIQLIIDGYNLKEDDIDNHFKSDLVRSKLKKYIAKYNQA